MNEALITQIALAVPVILQLVKHYFPNVAERVGVLPGLSVLLGILAAIAMTLPAASPLTWAWAYAVAIHGVVGGLTAAGLYSAAMKRIFAALAEAKPPALGGPS